MRYDAILIDADDTLLDFRAAEESALREMLRALGLDTPEAEACYRACNRACWAALERGEITQARLRHKRFEDFLRLQGRADDPAQVGEAYLETLSKQDILLPGALDVVRVIAEFLPVALVTNGIASVQHGRIDHSPLRPYLKAVVISEEIGCAKPNPRMIHTALKALGGVSPTRALMVGDSLQSDILCAKNAGTDACFLSPDGVPCPADLRPRYTIRRILELPPIALS